MIKKILNIFFILLVIACNVPDSKKQDSDNLGLNSSKIDSTETLINIKQDSNNVLGDKVLLSNEKDKNGLSSPDTIIIFEEFSDSTKALKKLSELEEAGNSFKLISTKYYHYKDKSKEYLLFSQNLSDSIINESSRISIIYKIRPNNFSDDKNLNPSELNEAYRNYHDTLVDETNALYLIKPKRVYSHARMFTRFINFNSEGVQQNNLTINDFEFADIDKTKDGYIVALNDFGMGAANYFNDVHYSFKVLWLDKNLNIIGDYHKAMVSTNINSVSYSQGKYFAVCELHTGCDMCDWNFCFFEIEFNKNFKPENIKILKQPKSHNVDPEFLLKIIKSKGIFTSTDLQNENRNN
ncbi:MAG: hypothetical protein K9J13_07525 [Saprospiraceae bacterium]|nr:hypothetical protein [Saprospiraceae bacterium]